MQVVRYGEAPSFAPKGHEGVLNRALVSDQWHGVPEVSVWHGSFEGHGEADLHVHEHAVQVYVVLTGAFVVGDGVEQWRLEVHDTAIVPAGESHMIAAAGGPGTILVVTTPALR